MICENNENIIFIQNNQYFDRFKGTLNEWQIR